MRLPPNKHGADHPKARLTQRQANLIRLKATQGIPQRKLAAEFHVSQMTVFRILWRQSYDD